ncbi:Uncharacterised protein [Ralstonia pickettii]|jgi:hypothetical protein|nr:hypothetical protein HMPREF1004_02550 [Ralstonia pickettii]EGY65207.1 hypothetical protein HMPREF0989_01782 [Ralstonia sp. 5_2_56FAA]SCW47884.1 hypothetical protein SAMN02799637_00926 [Ralstonia sp. UNCCL144]KFL22168.1 hypothetical protein DP23_77 [Ralstonia pickettii]QQK34754.1 hypothetical protein RP6297_00945 [Ralstonia pickettii]
MLLCIAVVATTAAPHGYVPTSQPEAFELRRIPVTAQGVMQLRANAFVIAFGQNIGAIWLNIRGASGVSVLGFFQGAVVSRPVCHRCMLCGSANEL